ncbi:hypothetical protein GCM10027592_26410 [Spirosoma flavus]
MDQLKVTTTTPGGGGSSGNVDTDGFLLYDDQGWIGADEKQIENTQVIIKFKKSVGGCPTWAALKTNNRNVICDQQVNNQFSDKGVQWQVSLYANPKRVFTINGVTKVGTGANPVPGGSDAPWYTPGIVIKSAVLNDYARGQVFCVKQRGLFWNWQNEPGNIVVDLEWWLVGRRIHYIARAVVEARASYITEQRSWVGQEQEKQSLYNIGDFNQHRTKINGSEYDMRTGLGASAPGVENFSDTFLTDACWAGTYNGDFSQGVTYFTPQNSAFKSWQKFGEGGEWNSGVSAYLVACPENNYDDIGTKTIDIGYMILGSKSDALTEIATLGGADQSFDFVFGGAVDPQWFSKDAAMKKIGNDIVFEVGTPNHDNAAYNTSRVNSPHRAWQASGISQIQFTIAVQGNGGNQDLKFIWGKPGKKSQNEYFKYFTVQADGVERTYTVNTADANWNGIISHIAIGGKDGMPTTTTIKLKRIKKP